MSPLLSSSSLLLLLLIVLVELVSADIIQVQVLARHGLRSMFHRDEIQVWDDGGQLSGHGYAQMASAGAAFRSRYLNVNNSTSGNHTDPSTAGSHLRITNGTDLSESILARSTDSQTSMMSATAFMLGLIPPGSGPVDELTGKAALPGQLNPVSVHTVPMPLDIPLRAYDKCPKYLDHLDEIMNTTEISRWETDNKEMLMKLSHHTNTNVTAATYLDAFEILDVEHGFNNMTNITSTDYDELKKLAGFISEKLFTGPDTNRMLAGRVLGNMAQQIAAAVDIHNVTIPFVYLSGQYPTIMAVYSALGVYNSKSVDPDIISYHSLISSHRGGIPAELPSPGAALVIELHQSSETSFAVRVLVHDPVRDRQFREVVLAACDGHALCPLDRFMPALVMDAIPDPSAWCQLCNNTVTAPCNAGQTVQVPVPVGPCTPPSQSDSDSVSTVTDPDRNQSAVISALIGIGLGLLLAALIYAMIRCLKSSVVQDRLLPRIQDAWSQRGTRTPNHIELPA